MESMLPYDNAMAPELELLDEEIGWLIDLASQDHMLLEELAELFRLDDTPSMNQPVTPSEVEPCVGGTPPAQNIMPCVWGDAPRNDPGFCTAESEGTTSIDLSVWDDFWTPDFSFTMEDPGSMPIQFHDQGSADLTEPGYLFSPLSTGPITDSQHDTRVHEIDTASVHITSRLEQQPDTSICDAGVDAAIVPLSRTGVTDDNMSETQAPSQELKVEDQDSTDAGTLVLKYEAWGCISNNATADHQVTITPTRKGSKRRKASLDPDGSDSPPEKRLCTETCPDPTAPSGATSDIRREAGIDTHSSQLRDALDAKRSRTPKRRHRSPLRKREEPKLVTLRDIAEPDGYIKGSFPLHIHSLDMHPDPTDSFMLQYCWDRREKLWVTSATGNESVSQEVLPARTMTAEHMCRLVEDIPALFNIYLRVGCSMNFVMEWDDSENSFIIDDPIEW
ncbi:hypothetical protein B0T21DRAFT_433681, partial [Apiosordaria backusii]